MIDAEVRREDHGRVRFHIQFDHIGTVGVGQAEYDVVSAADTVLVVLCPGAGDSIQAMKSGLLEVADVIVVNKNDVLGSDRLVLDLEEAVHIRLAGSGKWVEKRAVLEGAYFTGGLARGADLVLKHLGGDDTVFHMVELDRAAAPR